MTMISLIIFFFFSYISDYVLVCCKSDRETCQLLQISIFQTDCPAHVTKSALRKEQLLLLSQTRILKTPWAMGPAGSDRVRRPGGNSGQCPPRRLSCCPSVRTPSAAFRPGISFRPRAPTSPGKDAASGRFRRAPVPTFPRTAHPSPVPAVAGTAPRSPPAPRFPWLCKGHPRAPPHTLAPSARPGPARPPRHGGPARWGVGGRGARAPAAPVREAPPGVHSPRPAHRAQ